MHKIFAKPLFLGKKVVFLPQCHSTNEQMIQMVRQDSEPEGLVIYSDHQLSGRGQRGNKWVATSGDSILMSILLKPAFLKPSEQFYLNLIAGLAVAQVVALNVSAEVFLKWPNDVFVGDRKIAGILIENTIRGNRIEHAVVGIGLNVYQNGFDRLRATSLKMEDALPLDRAGIMEDILLQLEIAYRDLKAGNMKKIREAYLQKLYWKDQPRIFETANGQFEGRILGINQNGQLLIGSTEKVLTFDVKQVKFIR